jgi:hypothetical protein
MLHAEVKARGGGSGAGGGDGGGDGSNGDDCTDGPRCTSRGANANTHKHIRRYVDDVDVASAFFLFVSDHVDPSMQESYLDPALLAASNASAWREAMGELDVAVNSTVSSVIMAQIKGQLQWSPSTFELALIFFILQTCVGVLVVASSSSSAASSLSPSLSSSWFVAAIVVMMRVVFARVRGFGFASSCVHASVCA